MKHINNRASEELQSLTKGNEDRFVLKLKTALHKDKDIWRNLFSTLELIKRTEQTTSEKLDYEDFRLEKQYLTLEEGNRFLEEIEQGKLTINEYSGTITPYGEAFKFVGSGTTDWFLRVRWPTRLYKYFVQADSSFHPRNDALASLNFPLYRNGNDALKAFFDFEVANPYFSFSQNSQFYVLMTDYRARIKELRIRYTKVTIRIETDLIKEEDLRLRVFGRSNLKSFNSELLKLNNGEAELDMGIDLDYVLVYLFSITGDVIDFKEWGLGWTHIKDRTIVVERPDEQIKSIIEQGEGQDIEFKTCLDNKEDFLETVVAFSNTDGGLIIIGVDDNGKVKGFKGNNDDMLKMIHDSCEPPITPRFQNYNDIDGFPITVLELESGTNKPYLLKSNGIAYVRHGSNDFPPSRTELDEMYEKEESNPYS